MILLTGATGFTGSYVIDELLKKSYPFTCFVRASSDVTKIKELGLPLVFGDLDDMDSLCNALQDKKGLINIASLGFGHAPNLIDACKRMNVSRALFVSTTSIFTQLNTESKAVRLQAERTIKESGLEYTILRPTMIYGSPRDRNMWKLINHLQKNRILPVLGSGTFLQQPIYVGDLAWAIVKAYETKKSVKKEYDLSGLDALTYNEIVDTTREVLKKKILKVHIPYHLCIIILKLYQKISSKPMIKVEQVMRLNEHKNFSHEKAKIDFAFKPKSFKEGISLEIENFLR